jgi:hypothetical protein
MARQWSCMCSTTSYCKASSTPRLRLRGDNAATGWRSLCKEKDAQSLPQLRGVDKNTATVGVVREGVDGGGGRRIQQGERRRRLFVAHPPSRRGS